MIKNKKKFRIGLVVMLLSPLVMFQKVNQFFFGIGVGLFGVCAGLALFGVGGCLMTDSSAE